MSVKQWVGICERNGTDTTRLSPIEVYAACGKPIQNKTRDERKTPQWMKDAARNIQTELSAGHGFTVS